MNLVLPNCIVAWGVNGICFISSMYLAFVFCMTNTHTQSHNRIDTLTDVGQKETSRTLGSTCRLFPFCARSFILLLSLSQLVYRCFEALQPSQDNTRHQHNSNFDGIVGSHDFISTRVLLLVVLVVLSLQLSLSIYRLFVSAFSGFCCSILLRIPLCFHVYCNKTNTTTTNPTFNGVPINRRQKFRFICALASSVASTIRPMSVRAPIAEPQKNAIQRNSKCVSLFSLARSTRRAAQTRRSHQRRNSLSPLCTASQRQASRVQLTCAQTQTQTQTLTWALALAQ